MIEQTTVTTDLAEELEELDKSADSFIGGFGGLRTSMAPRKLCLQDFAHTISLPI